MNDAFIYEAVRTPFGRFGGALAGVRPDDLAAHALRSLLERAGLQDRGGDRRRDPRQRQRRGRGQPRRRAHGGAARRPADHGHRRHASTGCAARASRRRSRRRAPIALRRRVARRRRRRGVDEPRAVGSAEAVARLSRPLTRRCTRRRSAGGWSIRGCPSSGRSRSARAPRSWPRCTAISREEQDAFALRSHRLAAAAYDDGRDGRGRGRCPGVELARDEGIRADTTLEALAAARAGVRRGRHRHGRQLLAAQRRREHGADRRPARRRAARSRAARADRLDGRARRRPRRVRDRAGRGGEHGARARRDRLGRHRRRRAQRGVRLAVAGLPGGLAGARPRARQRARRRDRRSAIRWARRGRGSSAASPTSCTRAAAATVWRRSASALARASP